MKKIAHITSILLILFVISLSDLNPLLLWEPWGVFVNSLSLKFILGIILLAPIITMVLYRLGLPSNKKQSNKKQLT